MPNVYPLSKWKVHKSVRLHKSKDIFLFFFAGDHDGRVRAYPGWHEKEVNLKWSATNK